MTEKNIFVYKLFLTLNISDFILFFCRIATLPGKCYSPFFQQSPSQSWSPLKPPPFWKFRGRFKPPSRRSGCAHFGCTLWSHLLFCAQLKGGSNCKFWEKTLKIIDNFPPGAFSCDQLLRLYALFLENLKLYTKLDPETVYKPPISIHTKMYL